MVNRKEWEIGVGKFMLAAGVIELRMLQLLWNLAIPHEYDRGWVRLSFSRKIYVIKGLVKKSELHKELEESIHELLFELKRIMEVRNIIAHNPISTHMVFDGAETSGNSEFRGQYT